MLFTILARRSGSSHGGLPLGLVVLWIDRRVVDGLVLPRVFRRRLSGRDGLKHGLVVLTRGGFRVRHARFLLFPLQAVVVRKVPRRLAARVAAGVGLNPASSPGYALWD